MTKFCDCSTSCITRLGFCHCGCGGSTTIASRNDKRRNWRKGEPIRYIRGHAYRERRDSPDVHALFDIDHKNRRAICSKCGIVTIKKDSSRSDGWRCTETLNTQHRLGEVDEDKKTGWCRGCLKEVRIIFSGGRWKCRTGIKSHQVRDTSKNHEAIKERRRKEYRDNGWGRHLFANYGISEQDYGDMVSRQKGICAICHEPPPAGEKLCVDHCHTSSTVRELLCRSCNSALGLLRDNPKIISSALDYITRHQNHSD